MVDQIYVTGNFLDFRDFSLYIKLTYFEVIVTQTLYLPFKMLILNGLEAINLM